jgi:MFS family permease
MAAATMTDNKRDTSKDLSESDATIRLGEEANMPLGDQDAEAGKQTSAAQPSPTSDPPGPPPPNGGLAAYTQVAASFFVFFNTWGVLNTFGVFQTYYESGALFEQSSSNISWIGSVQSYCLLLVGLIAGPIYDRGYLRALLGVGSFLIVFGFMMLSLCAAYWQAVLAQGFCIGIGAGLLFVPSLAVLPSYFSTRLGLALGLAASGSSFGGVIYPIVFYKLLQQTSFAWAVRTLGFLALLTLLVPLLFMRQRAKPAKPRSALDWTAFSDFPFAAFTVFTMVGFIGLYVVLFYISYYALASGAADPEMAFYLVPILNVASMLGRTLPNALSDKVGALNSMTPSELLYFDLGELTPENSPSAGRSNLRCPHLCAHWGDIPSWDRHRHASLWLHVGCFYCTAAGVLRCPDKGQAQGRYAYGYGLCHLGIWRTRWWSGWGSHSGKGAWESALDGIVVVWRDDGGGIGGFVGGVEDVFDEGEVEGENMRI